MPDGLLTIPAMLPESFDGAAAPWQRDIPHSVPASTPTVFMDILALMRNRA
jgi:hypothetical protein